MDKGRKVVLRKMCQKVYNSPKFFRTLSLSDVFHHKNFFVSNYNCPCVFFGLVDFPP